MTFEDWLHKKHRSGLSRLDNAWYDLAQEFQSGGLEDQLKVIERVMKEAWEARYHTLTCHDL